MVKSIFNTVKNFRATLFCRASASCSKILNNKKYIFSTVNSRHLLFFRASAKLLKILNGKKYIQCSEKFQGKRKLLKILNVKSILDTVKIFRATLFLSGQGQIAQKSRTVKKFSI